MTDRLKGFVVTLETDIREDDAEQIRQAILTLRDVAAVEPVPSDINDHINRTRIRREIMSKFWDILKEN